jgi:predicted cupin superfamily sugar epimerase
LPESIAAARWIRELDLAPHPEGGWYRESYRAGERFPGAAQTRFPAGRSLSTAIYFLLDHANFSAFHRIRSDELWHHYDGDGTDVHVIEPGGDYRRLALGRGEGRQPQAVVPAGCWFAAEVARGGDFALLGCTVAPGFDFADFELADGIALADACAQHAPLVRRLSRT